MGKSMIFDLEHGRSFNNAIGRTDLWSDRLVTGAKVAAETRSTPVLSQRCPKDPQPCFDSTPVIFLFENCVSICLYSLIVFKISSQFTSV